MATWIDEENNTMPAYLTPEQDSWNENGYTGGGLSNFGAYAPTNGGTAYSYVAPSSGREYLAGYEPNDNKDYGYRSESNAVVPTGNGSSGGFTGTSTLKYPATTRTIPGVKKTPSSWKIQNIMATLDQLVPTNEYPTYTAPTMDRSRISELTQKASAPGTNKLSNALNTTLSQISSSPTISSAVKRDQLASALSGYGQGLSSVMGQAQQTGLQQYMPEYNTAVDASKINYANDYRTQTTRMNEMYAMLKEALLNEMA